jgi:transmembrane sensor
MTLSPMTQPSDPHPPNDPIYVVARTWFLRLGSGAVSRADLARFEAWRDEDSRHALAYDEVRAAWNDAEDLRAAFAPSVARIRRREKAIGRRGAIVGGLIAAGIALFVASALDLPTRLEADYRTGSGQQAEVSLPDGSIAVLNTDTAIAVDFSHHRRVSLLRGEVWFKVAKDRARPFEVLALKGQSTALGTEFAIRDRTDTATVTVNEGAVLVTSPADAGGAAAPPSSATLRAGDRVSYRKGAAPGPIQRANAVAAPAWRHGLIAIDTAPFADAIAEIGRYHPGRILLLADTAQLQPVTARLSLASIDSGLDALAATHGLKVTRITRYVTIIH